MNLSDKKYIDFSSTLSFFEFTQNEFYEPKFKIEDYRNEIDFLSKNNNFTYNSLSDGLKKFPKLFDIFEQLLMLFSFTNTQIVHFFFDIHLLNYGSENELLKYLQYNLKIDSNFKQIFDSFKKENILDNSDRNEIFLFKKTIEVYKEKIKKDRNWIYTRLSNDITSRDRMSTYLIDNQQINKILESVLLANFLKNKRINKDTKNIHGNYGHLRIEKILKECGYLNIDPLLKENKIKNLLPDLNSYDFIPKNTYIFCSEKYVDNIEIPKKNKLKKFDFLIFDNMEIKYLIETNFYSTVGTKISINEQEYVDLNEEIKLKLPNANLLWVSDGNYWLSTVGKEMFIRDYEKFFGDNLLNYFQLNKLLKFN